MRSIMENNFRMLSGMLATLFFLSIYSTAAAEEKEGGLFGASVDMGYVMPNMWAGWKLSNGACIQPTFTFTIGEFNIGTYMNMYGSEADRRKNSMTGEPMYGKYMKGFGMIDEVQFFAGWEHGWKWFSLGASFWYLAYTWQNTRYSNTQDSTDRCEWFGQMAGGELTISPAVHLGPFSIFTDQNVVVVARERKWEQWVNDSTVNVTTKNALGDYHGVLGAAWATGADDTWSIELSAKAEWANMKFIREWLESRVKKKKPQGIYHITIGANSSYNILPQLSISGNFNVDFITNYWVRFNSVYNKSGNNGCIPYGGIHLTYTWSQ